MPVSAIAWSTASSTISTVAGAGGDLVDDVAAGHRRLATEGDVLLDGERRPQLRLLERAAEARAGRAPPSPHGSRRGPWSRIRPRVGRTSPEQALNVVVFPAPFGPIKPGDATERRVEAQAVDRDEPAVADGEVDDLEPAAARRRRRAPGPAWPAATPPPATPPPAPATSSGARRPPSRSRNRRTGAGTMAGWRAWRPTPITANPKSIWR